MVGQRHVVIIGGGISGLTVAFRLLGQENAPAVTVLESGDRLGGKIASATVAGLTVDTGPDSLLVRMPAARDLLDDLGLQDEVAGQSGSGAYVWTRGALRPLPPASLFGVPERLLPLLTSGLVTPIGLARAGADLVLPRTTLSSTGSSTRCSAASTPVAPNASRPEAPFLRSCRSSTVHAASTSRCVVGRRSRRPDPRS